MESLWWIQLDFNTPKSPENAFSEIFTYLKLVLKYYNFAIFQQILCKTYEKSLQKQAVNMDLQCILCIAYSSYAVKTPKDEIPYDSILEFLQKIENLDMSPSKREISRSNGRMGDNLSKPENTVQNGTVGTYAASNRWKGFQNIHFHKNYTFRTEN